VTDRNKHPALALENEPSEQSTADNQGQKMLSLAREAIRYYLETGLTRSRAPDDAALTKCAAVFVTLWSPLVSNENLDFTAGEQLRGCIGTLEATSPLYKGIQESAVNAASRDPRFSPITLQELDKIRIEIAILSQFQEIHDLKEITIGKHGLLIEGLGKRGLLLPKVAKRLNLSRNDFYTALCDKAGLPVTCWPSAATLYTFTTITVNE